ncbi:MAG: hypothetical protein H6622_05605 [Halobacteriovoraceae bacterium]|nr:hypothetical protein [Halobacteriovoraceae bacterium]
MDFFIGLTFHQNQFQFKKIDRFRKCFDSKTNHSTILQMTLLPPFKIPYQDVEMFIDHVEEDLEVQLHNINTNSEIVFKGLDFFQGQNGMLFLRPEIPDNIFHCMESIWDNINSFKGRFSKKKHGKEFDQLEKNVVLPLGRFNNPHHLEEALQEAKEHFQFPMRLMIREIDLFEKIPGHWPLRRRLFIFPKNSKNSLEHFELSLPEVIIE